jgi:hypothetical protein
MATDEQTYAAWREHYRTFANYPPHEQARRVISERIAQAIERKAARGNA